MTNDYGKAERLTFIQINQEARNALKAFRPVVEANMAAILEKFYGHVASHPTLSRLFSDPKILTHARTAQGQHWLHLFEGGFDDAYVERVRRIGKTHERIGLEPRWYIGGYALATSELIALAVKTYAKEPEKLTLCLKSMTKAIYLDMDFAISIYIEEGEITYQKKLQELADGFEGSVKKVVDGFGQSAEEMQSTSETLQHSAESTSQLSSAVAAASEQASHNVATVAAATEELSASVGEISRQVAQSSRISREAVDKAQATNDTVKRLSDSAVKIGQVVKLINDVASQTNLLALNATIEAARAGEAGKGFAVVAAEVKTLAKQTARATEEISTQIQAIQSVTQEAVAAIQGIGSTIGELSGIANAVAAAVEEQGAATQEITRNVQQASTGTAEVSANIAGVSQSTVETGEAAKIVRQTADDLARQSSGLHEEIGKFLVRIRAA
jgi:methyl-accepting chemotaxis protein